MQKLVPLVFILVDGTRRSPRSATRGLERPGMSATGADFIEVGRTSITDAVEGEHMQS